MAIVNVAARPPFLLAVGDGIQLSVSRSLVVSTDSEGYQPVKDYISEHGMVLVATETGPEEGMYGQVEQSHYAIPDARQLLMMDGKL